MIKLGLELMGFDKQMIEALFLYETQVIEDANHAVELLIPGPNGYLHTYIGVEPAPCSICKGDPNEH